MSRLGYERSTALRMLGTVLVAGGIAGLLLAWPSGRETTALPTTEPPRFDAPATGAPVEPMGTVPGGTLLIGQDGEPPAPPVADDAIPAASSADAATLMQPSDGAIGVDQHSEDDLAATDAGDGVVDDGDDFAGGGDQS